MNDTIIRNAAGILTGRPGPAGRARGDIRISGGRIAEIGDIVPLPSDRVIDATDSVVYPGLVNTHHHLFQTMLKAVPAGMDVPLEPWLEAVPYRYWTRVDEAALRVAAQVGMAELLLSGVTTTADHHYLFTDGMDFDHAGVLFDVAGSLGLRFVLCRGGATRQRLDLPEGLSAPLESLDTMLDRMRALVSTHNDTSATSMRRVVMAPSTPLWSLHPHELDEVAAAARHWNIRLHGHLSETRLYVQSCLRLHNKLPVHWVAEHSWLGPDVWYAHLVHTEESELKLLAETGTGMAHCPQSNCRLGSGIAQADRLAAMDGRVSLGVDGAASNESADMLSEMQCAFQVHRATKGATAVTAEQILRWASAGGADILGFPDCGTIELGKLADIAIFDLVAPRFAGMHDKLIGPIIAGGARARHVLVAGRPVVENYLIPGLDLGALHAAASGVVQRLAA